MKKYLLATTMAVAIAGFGASTLAKTVINGSVHPKDKRLNIKISGQFTPVAWVASQKIEFIPLGTRGFAQNPVAVNPIDKTRGYDFRNYYNRLRFEVYGKADSWDLNYNGHARFVLGGGARTTNPNVNNIVSLAGDVTFVDRLAVQLWGKWGFLEFGDDTSRLFKDNHYSGTIMTGIGGWDSFFIGSDFITTTNTINSPFPDQFESNNTKVTYKSAAYYGFSIGLTWTPDTGHRGDNPLIEVNNPRGRGNFENVYDVSVEYVQSFLNDKLGVKVLAAWQAGEAENQLNNVSDIEVFSISGELSYNGFQIAGDFTDLNNSGISSFGRRLGVDAGRIWDVGAAYRTGAWGIFASYMNTSRNTGRLTGVNNLSAGNDNFVSPVAVDIDTNFNDNVVVPALARGNIIPGDSKARLWAVSAGIEFTLAPGITTFLEFTHVENDDNTSVSILFNNGVNARVAGVGREVTAVADQFQDNSGDFVVLGTKVKF